MTETSTTGTDKTQAAHFNSMSEWWWSVTEKGGTILRMFNEVRVPHFLDSVLGAGAAKEEYRNTTEPLRELNVLEVGCGGGLLSEELARLGCNLTGVDIAEDAINVAKQHAALDPTLSNLTYECTSVEEHAVKNFEKYDVVVASEVIEHTNAKRQFLEACLKCLKPGGFIYVSTINKTYAAWLVVIILAEYVFKVIPKGSHEYDELVPPQEIENMFKEFNCHDIAAPQGMNYNFFKNKWHFTSINSFWYAMHAIKCKTST